MKKDGRRGQALVEFALVFPVLFLIILGIVDFGRAVYAYNTVSNAAREAGRSAIINQDISAIRARASTEGTLLGLPTGDPGGCPAAGGPSLTAISGTCVKFRSADLSSACSTIEIGCTAVVSVQWQFQAITPVIGNIVGLIPITATSKFAIENVCPRTGVATNQCLSR